MDAQLLRLVQAGDVKSADALLRAVPTDVLAGDEGSSLLRAAMVAGYTDVVESLLDAGVDPNRAWTDGADPVSWAADHGASRILQELLSSNLVPWRKQLPEDAARKALQIARPWLDVDPVLELRRRLGVVQEESVVVECERIPVTDWGLHTTRIRVTAADGRHAEVQTSHRAIVTYLEGRLGVPACPDELLARARFYADPLSCDWAESQTVLANQRDPEETFRWAANLVAHPSVDTRRFVTDVLHRLSFDERPFKTQALEVLRPRLRAEEDPIALDNVIGAFASYTGRGDLTDLLPHARHPNPEIRRRVAGELSAAIGELPQTAPRPDPPLIPFATPPDVVGTLIELASDVDDRTRANALLTLAESGIDTQEVRDLMVARLTDEYQDARVEAAVGLALRDDPQGVDALRQMGARARYDTHVGQRLYWADRILAHRVAERRMT
ncbi:HEAT repeat domain-containing protein [Micromonospora sp. HK10]|uniref:HEAT repeat domain-containing protein n=1 Tax=Micromonospora sp. HK10 TaxID=1538294 RepID=UPI0006270BCE|nr:HEAT repeat domain-containing protein [Micromonospora sp. HK10]KKK04949.1 hypothetical protein LQ51_16240 [Micromonospora sp. HK10]